MLILFLLVWSGLIGLNFLSDPIVFGLVGVVSIFLLDERGLFGVTYLNAEMSKCTENFFLSDKYINLLKYNKYGDKRIRINQWLF